jgi:hypothetical protein
MGEQRLKAVLDESAAPEQSTLPSTKRPDDWTANRALKCAAVSSAARA